MPHNDLPHPHTELAQGIKRLDNANGQCQGKFEGGRNRLQHGRDTELLCLRENKENCEVDASLPFSVVTY